MDKETGIPFEIRSREELEKAGTPLPLIQGQVQRINAQVGWSDYNRATDTYFENRSVSCLCARKVKEGDICGYVVVKYLETGSEDKDVKKSLADIPYIATASKAQGIGLALFRGAIAEAAKRQCTQIQWECRPKVVGFYEKAIAKSGVKKVTQEQHGFYRNGDIKTYFMCSLFHESGSSSQSQSQSTS